MTEGTKTTARDTGAPDEFLTIEQAAERMGLDSKRGAWTVRVLTAAGEGPDAVTVGGDTVYAASAVDKWLAGPYSVRTEVRGLAHSLRHSVRVPFPDENPHDRTTIVHGESDQCAPWCDYRHGMPSDRQTVAEPCFGADQAVTMALMPFSPEDGLEANQVKVMAYRRVGGRDVVMVQYNDEDELRFSPAEFGRFLDAGRAVLASVENINEVEQARQDGYDTGYADARSVHERQKSHV